ncbi:hypothetical protein HMPREF9296_0502 [Prevotella disiens FB035-09AN]|uniref:Uncharacterized protein n=1 Tax=Prevotella disiens FB035-09AN TaxID=866771 RepID=E1KT27_9BACT|nr:hypothetical protein HMPREF9296_0502 [Prevotella disiens FB035-09AN]
MLEAERQAEDAIINAKAEKQQLEQQKDKRKFNIELQSQVRV